MPGVMLAASGRNAGDPPASNGLLTNLVAFWKLDEASGNAIDALVGNDLTETSGTIGTGTGLIYSTARDFEAGDTEYFTRASTADLVMGDIDCTFALWLKFESLSAQQYIFQKADFGGSFNPEYVLYSPSSPFLRWRVYGGAGGGSSGTVNSSVNPLSTGAWHFVVCEHDATANEIRIRINNGTPDVTSHSAGIRAGTVPFYLGETDSGSNPFDGLMQSFGIWKTLLNDDQLTALYNAGAGMAFEDFD